MASKEPGFSFWELPAGIFAGFPAVMALYNRNSLFHDTRYGLFDDDAWVLALWLLLGAALLVWGKPWQRLQRWGSRWRLLCLSLSLISLAFTVFLSTGVGRYGTVIFETRVANLRITNYSDGLRTDLGSELLDPVIGPRLTRNPGLLKHLVAVSDDSLLKQPRAARVLVTALAAAEGGVEPILDLPGGPAVAFVGLLGEADPQPWHRLEWVPKPELNPQPELGLRAGIFSPPLARRVLQTALTEQPEEPLLFAMMNFPTLFLEPEREELLKRWGKEFEDLEELAVEGLVMRAQLKELLGETDSVSVAVVMNETSSLGSVYRHVPETLPRMIVGLVTSCGVMARPAPPDEAELVFEVRLSQVAHHEWSRPTYKYETYYEYQSTGRSIRGYSMGSRRVRKERRVSSGSETVTAFVPVAKVQARFQGRTLEYPESLLHWHNFRYDYENNRFLDLDKENVFGRMWPLGIHERNFVFGYMTDVY